MENKIKLWGAGTTRTLRPIWMAEELGIDYALMPIGPRTGETQSKEYTDLNPKQKIPFLENGEIKLSESLAICRYLQYTFPSDKIFIPKNNIDKAKEADIPIVGGHSVDDKEPKYGLVVTGEISGNRVWKN